MQTAIELTKQIIALAEAKDKEYLKLLEKVNCHPIWGNTKKIIQNGEDCIVFHLKVLLELLEKENIK